MNAIDFQVELISGKSRFMQNYCQLMAIIGVLLFYTKSWAQDQDNKSSGEKSSQNQDAAKPDSTQNAVQEPPAKKPIPIRLSLDECIKRAIARSDEIEAEQHRLEALQAEIDQLSWAPFSNFKLSGVFSMVPDKCVDTDILDSEGRIVGCNGGKITDEYDYNTKEWGPTFHLEFSGGVPIYTFGKLSNAKEAARNTKSAKEAYLPTIAHQIRYNVSRAYHAIVGAREMLYTISQGRKHLDKAQRRIEENLKKQEGTETEIDLMKLKLYQSQVNVMEKQAKKIERVGLAALSFFLKIQEKENIDIADDPQQRDEREILLLNAYKERALKNRPELAALRKAIKAMEAKVALKKSEFFPNLIFVTGWRFGVTPGRTDVESWLLRDSYNYGSWVPTAALVLEYNFDFGLDAYRLKEAKAELAALSTDQKRALEGIMLEVENAYLDVVASRDTLNDLEESKRIAKGWMNGAVQNNEAGVGSSKEVKDAVKEYFTVMASMHQVIGELNIGMVKLDQVTGFVDDDSGK